MTNAANGAILTEAQAACLETLRNPGVSEGRIAVAAKLSLDSAGAALLDLQEMGYVRRTGTGLWLATPIGETCSFETVPDRPRPKSLRADRRSSAPQLPVRSDRVRLVLQTLADERALRIKDVKLLTSISQNSINALMQYLKRKRLVAKDGDGFGAPYRLTEKGYGVLAEMGLRRAA